MKLKEGYPYGYFYEGGNYAGPNAYYQCSYCDLNLIGDEVSMVAAGSNYANGEHAPCPRCGEENEVDRDDDD